MKKIKNKGNTILPEEKNKSPITNPKETEIYELPDQKIIILKLRELQDNTNNIIEKMIHEKKNENMSKNRNYKGEQNKY